MKCNFLKIIIHLGAGSDGLDPQMLKTEVSKATSSGQRVFTVGVGSGWTQSMLRESSSQPSTRYAMSSRSFQELPEIIDTLLERVSSGMEILNDIITSNNLRVLLSIVDNC